ncbi:DUF397 domain-containing protein [Streptomyces noursei]
MNSSNDLSHAQWRKSSYSGDNNGQCVEIADNFPKVVPVRDSKDKEGPALRFQRDAFSAFIEQVKGGRFDG